MYDILLKKMSPILEGRTVSTEIPSKNYDQASQAMIYHNEFLLNPNSKSR